MKKLMFVFLTCLFVSFAHAETGNSLESVDMLESYANGYKEMKARVLRKAQLQSEIATANLKIAAFEVEIAKEKLNKTLAEAALVQMEKN